MTMNVTALPKRRPPEITVGDRARIVRRAMHLSQEAFAHALSNYIPVGAKAYAAWEAGTNEPGNVPALCNALEQYTGYPREWFLGWWVETPDPGNSQQELRSGYSRTQNNVSFLHTPKAA
jgi:transcriptional regulator with XRE-family HTH domain